jgi:uncharacterized protein YjbI with pentapeptide repeats/lysophospholipase L1-like esterase
MNWILFSLILLFVGIVIIPNVHAETVPDWVKNTAGWWADDAISETEFVNAVGFLVNKGIIQIQTISNSEKSETVPDWVKNTAGWWADDAISETEFVNAVGFLVNKGIIQVNNECKFDTDAYPLLSIKDKWFLCNLNYEYLSEWAEDTETIKVEINSKGFRGVEFSEVKPDNTIRIFAVGGSTTYGNGVTEEYTYPAILQKKINLLKLEKNVEIINAGYGGAWSKTETDLIKNKLLQYDPDIFIIYDGWNEIQNEVFNNNNNEQQWKDRWTNICKLGNEKEFETIILLQPTIGTISTEKRIPVDQEIIIWNIRQSDHQQLTQTYAKYPSMISELDQNCTVAKNFQNIFDEEYSAIFYDYGHINALGNKILAENVLETIKPILSDKFKISITTQKDSNSSIPVPKIIPEKLDYRGEIIENISFANMDMKNANFQYALIENVDFSNANLEGTDFRFSTIMNSKFIGADLKKSIFARSEIQFSDFSGANLENSYITVSRLNEIDFTNSNLMNSKIMGVEINESTFLNSKLKNLFLHQSKLYNSNIFDANFSNITLSHAFLVSCDSFGKDLSQINIQSKTRFVDCNLDEVIVPLKLNDVDFSPKIHPRYGLLKGTSLSGVDFSNADISRVLFAIDAKLSENNMENKKFTEYGVDLSFSNLSDKNLSNKNLDFTNLSYTILTNTDLSFASLQFANLEGANLEGANLEGANLEGANLECMNHEICK